MKKQLFTLLVLIYTFVWQVPVCAQGIGSNELIKNAQQYDGKQIIYSGEVIGDVMARGEFSWVNINDGENALGVWISASLAKEISFTGSYKTRGDNLEIMGTFHRVCVEHGGDLDIHAQSLRKLSSGRVVKEKAHSDKVKVSLILLGAIFIIWTFTLFKHK